MSTYNRTQTLQISTITINGQDVRLWLVGLNIYEDLFSHFLSCDLTLMDPVSLTEFIPIFGGETLSISFKSHNADGGFEEYTKDFRIYSITDMTQEPTVIGQKGRVYTLHAISPQAFTNMENRISRPYEKMRECQIVQSVCDNILGITNLRVDACKFEKSIVVPNWSPIKLIEHCSHTAIRQGQYEACNYVFYEDRDQFNFVSLDMLLEQGPSYVLTSKITRHLTNKEYTRLNAKSYKNTKNFDQVENRLNGMYGTRYYGINFFEKKLEKFDYIYADEFGKQVKIDGDNQMLVENPPSFPEQKIFIGPYEPSIQFESQSRKSDKWGNKHKAMIQQYKNYDYYADVDGDSNIRVGQIIDFELPSYDSLDDKPKKVSQELDDYLSGHYLVGHIRHYIDHKEHRMILGLIKPQLKTG